MTFEEVIQPALDLVENGHPVDDQFHAFASRELGGDPSTTAVFNPGAIFHRSGRSFSEGSGNTFRRMIDAERGASGNRETGIKAARDLIYKGEIAHEIADFPRPRRRTADLRRSRRIFGSCRATDSYHLQGLRRLYLRTLVPGTNLKYGAKDSRRG